VRKAGGVYYTPTYIVDTIVRQTVGRLVAGHAPDPAGPVSRRRVLDPACGSGSFLLGAYQFLLDWHLAGYLQDTKKWARKRGGVLHQTATGEYRLTLAERKRILLDNLYGVDIDPQAVEVTKLSLLLKVLEDTPDALSGQLALFSERVLPDLGDNIKCGNSLIGPEFYAQAPLLPDADATRINAFDWQREFKEIMSNGGFDAVIGNPPWLMAGYYLKDSMDYLKRSYRSTKGKFDLYYPFIELGIRLLSRKGYLGMIVPNKLFHTKAASELRRMMAETQLVSQIVDFGDHQLFAGATNYSCIVVLSPNAQKSIEYISSDVGFQNTKSLELPASILSESIWHFEDTHVRGLFEKVRIGTQPLMDLTERFGTGTQSGADRVLMFDATTAETLKLEPEVLRPIFRGRDVRRYALSSNPKLLMFPYRVQDDEFQILSEKELTRYPRAYELLKNNKKKLEDRVWFGKSGTELSGKWYGLMYLDSYKAFASPHLLTPSLSDRSNFTLGNGSLFATGTAGVTSIILKPTTREGLLYVLGVLNSKLLSFYATAHSPVFSGGYYKFSAPYLKQLPIRTIDFSDPVDRARHDHMVALVERMLDLHRRLAAGHNPQTRTILQRQIEATDRQIDGLVYELYGLTTQEVQIVEA
jgi:hypothetical protein